MPKETPRFLRFFKFSRQEPTAKELDIRKGINYLSENSRSADKIWELFRYFRSEIQHEYSLLMGRVTWYITCQSFLLTIYALTYSNNRGPNWFSNGLLPLLAIIISSLAYFMIQGATRTINMWGKLRQQLVIESSRSNPERGLNPLLIERWRLHDRRDWIHIRALWFPQFITGVFILTWIVIAYWSCQVPWISPTPAAIPAIPANRAMP